MDTIVHPDSPASPTSAENRTVVLDIISGPDFQSILDAVCEQNHALRTPSEFTAKHNSTKVVVSLTVNWYRPDRYDADYIIVDGKFNSVHQIGTETTNSQKRAKDFCSQVQLRYKRCTCESNTDVIGQIHLTRQPAA